MSRAIDTILRVLFAVVMVSICFSDRDGVSPMLKGDAELGVFAYSVGALVIVGILTVLVWAFVTIVRAFVSE